MKKLLFSTLVPLILAAGAASAQSPPSSPDEQFRSAFDRFVGEDWLFYIELFGADGEVTFSGVDIRRFEYGIGGVFLIENVYRMEDEAHIGIQLIGLDRQAGTVHLSTFFPWQPTALAEVTGRFTESGGISGQSKARLLDGTEVNGRFACEWLDGRWTCSSHIIEPDGTERIADRNYYCRRSDPDCGG